jgi:hypothetical protein
LFECSNQQQVSSLIEWSDPNVLAAELNRLVETVGAQSDLAQEPERSTLDVMHSVTLDVEPIAFDAGEERPPRDRVDDGCSPCCFSQVT